METLTYKKILKTVAEYFSVSESALIGSNASGVGKHETTFFVYIYLNVCKYVFPQASFALISKSAKRYRESAFTNIQLHQDRIEINSRPGFEKYNIARSECNDINNIIRTLNELYGANIKPLNHFFINKDSQCPACGYKLR